MALFGKWCSFTILFPPFALSMRCIRPDDGPWPAQSMNHWLAARNRRKASSQMSENNPLINQQTAAASMKVAVVEWRRRVAPEYPDPW